MENLCGIVLSYYDNDECNVPIAGADLLFKSVSLWTYEAIKKAGIKNICLAGAYKKTKEFAYEGIQIFCGDEQITSSSALLMAKDFINKYKDKNILIVSAFVPYWAEESLKNALNSYNEYSLPVALAVYQEGENENGATVGLIISAKELIKQVEKNKSFQEIAFNANKIPVVCKRLRNSAGVKALSDILRDKILERHINNGVYIPCTDGVIIGPDVEISTGTTILSGTIIKGKTTIGLNCLIGPNSFISDSELSQNVTIKASFCDLSYVGEGTIIGPFCNIRPNCHFGKQVKVGDFVEIKNSNVGDKTSIAHLTYVGDSDVGSKVNFGCGAVTVNYDGKNKFRTVIGDNVFIGCNSNFIAPVKVENNSYIAAGSTITDDVPENALAIARSRQIIKENWATNRNDK